MNEEEAKLEAIKMVLADLMQDLMDDLDAATSGKPVHSANRLLHYPETILKAIRQVELDFEFGGHNE